MQKSRTLKPAFITMAIQGWGHENTRIQWIERSEQTATEIKQHRCHFCERKIGNSVTMTPTPEMSGAGTTAQQRGVHHV
jgi:hypothetical protein